MKAERARLSVAIAERQRQIDAAETQQWCEGRSRRTPDTGTIITKSTPAKDDQAMTNDMTASWQRYIAGEVRAAERRVIESSMSAVAEVLAAEKKKLIAQFESRIEAEVLRLENRFLQSELDRERGVKRHLKAVPTDKAAIIA